MQLSRLRRNLDRRRTTSVVDAPEPTLPPTHAHPFDLHDTPHGPLWRRRLTYVADHAHGLVAIRDLLHMSPKVLAKLTLDTTVAQLDLSRAVFLDTETTGLARGTGTLPFLVGAAWFEDDQLMIEQMFLPEPGRELPMLAHLEARLAQASALVTYNGKSYDWPLLVTRYLLHRRRAPTLHAHVDMLHASRRVLRRRRGSVRLQDVERALLGVQREDDIAGHEIPDVYFRFLEHGHDARLHGVLHHNELDLLSLVAMLPRLAQCYAEPGAPWMQPDDCVSIASLAHRAGDASHALCSADAALAGGATGQSAFEACMLAARLRRRQGDHARAVALWHEATQVATTDEERACAHLALAKHYEHRAKDYALAHHHARHAEEAEPTEQRLRRLERLAQRAGDSR